MKQDTAASPVGELHNNNNYLIVGNNAAALIDQGSEEYSKHCRIYKSE